MELTSFTFERNGIEGSISYVAGEGLVIRAKRLATGVVSSRGITEEEAERIVAQVRAGNGRATFDGWRGAEALKASCLAELHEEAETLHPDDPIAQAAHLSGMLDACGCSLDRLLSK